MLSCLWLIRATALFVGSWLCWVTYPASTFIPRREEFGVKDLRQYLQAFDDARPRTVEILIAIRDKDALPLHCLQLAPAGAALNQWHLLKRSRYVEAARVHENNIRIGGQNLVPIEPWRRLAGRAKQIIATGHLDELRHPVATCHQRIDPLDHGAPRARSRHAALL